MTIEQLKRAYVEACFDTDGCAEYAAEAHFELGRDEAEQAYLSELREAYDRAYKYELCLASELELKGFDPHQVYDEVLRS